MGIRRVLAAAGAVVLATGGLSLAGAAPASADQVWHQSVSRVSATAACSTSSADDLAAGWSQWGATWEQWVNGGTGGFTCARSITWALDSPMSGVECTAFRQSFVLLDPSGFLPPDTPVYSDETCTVIVDSIEPGYGYVITSNGLSAAGEVCQVRNQQFNVVANLVEGDSLYACMDAV